MDGGATEATASILAKGCSNYMGACRVINALSAQRGNRSFKRSSKVSKTVRTVKDKLLNVREEMLEIQLPNDLARSVGAVHWYELDKGGHD